MKQHQVILLLVIPILVIAATFTSVIMTTMSIRGFAQTGNITDTDIKEYQFITKWGTPGSADGQFDGQNNVAGSGEFIYVPDYHNQRIQKFTNDGQFINMWGGSYGEADGEFKNPHGVALDSEGNLYVSERSGLRIQKFDPEGNFITKWGSEGTGNGQFQHLHDIAVGPGGNGGGSVSGSSSGSTSQDNSTRLSTDNKHESKWYL